MMKTETELELKRSTASVSFVRHLFRAPPRLFTDWCERTTEIQLQRQ